jgi:hypothetical protein
LTATHMLLRAWPLDARGHWVRRVADFAEDVVVACSACGDPPAGRVQRWGNCFRFVPRDGDDGASAAP